MNAKAPTTKKSDVNRNAVVSDRDIPQLAKDLIKKLAETQSAEYRLRWKGSKIPRGAKVGEAEISWTQQGIVSDKNGHRLGYYERRVEFGGPDNDEHEMIISSNAPVYDTQGDACEVVATSHSN